jgi:hypothetical protein
MADELTLKYEPETIKSHCKELTRSKRKENTSNEHRKREEGREHETNVEDDDEREE